MVLYENRWRRTEDHSHTIISRDVEIVTKRRNRAYVTRSRCDRRCHLFFRNDYVPSGQINPPELILDHKEEDGFAICVLLLIPRGIQEAKVSCYCDVVDVLFQINHSQQFYSLQIKDLLMEKKNQVRKR